jgi:hypothetical protein
MLTLLVYINQDQVDQINVHNIKIRDNGISDYEVLSTQNKRRLFPEVIKHQRKDGYRPLLKKVLTKLIKYKIGEFK